MPQWSLLKPMATYVSERPMSEMVGAMVRGPINCMRTPTSPVQPRNSCVRLATIRLPWICKCIVPQNIELLLFLYNSFVRVIRLIINRKYGVFCIYYVRSSYDNHNMIHWIKSDHVLLKMIMIMNDRKLLVNCPLAVWGDYVYTATENITQLSLTYVLRLQGIHN